MEDPFPARRDDAVALDVDASLGNGVGRLEQRARRVRKRYGKILGWGVVHSDSLPRFAETNSRGGTTSAPSTLLVQDRDVNPCARPPSPSGTALARSTRASRSTSARAIAATPPRYA